MDEMIWQVVLVTLLTCAVVAYILKKADLRANVEQLKRELRGD